MKCSRFFCDSFQSCLDPFSTFHRRLSYPLSSWAHPWCSWAPWNQTGKASSISGPTSPPSFDSTCTRSRPADSRLGNHTESELGGRKKERMQKGKKNTGRINAAMQFLLYEWFIPDLCMIYINLYSRLSLAIQWAADQLSNYCTVNLFAWNLL